MTMIPPSIPPAHAPRRTLGELLGMPPGGGDDHAPDGRGSAARRRKPLPLPLQGVSARVAIVGDCALTELTERYANPHDVPLDVKHTIPLPPGCAVIGVEIRAAGRTVHA
ncbi:MAG: VIT domain-containing protein, partial [Phycisphaerales bacterium]